MEEKQWTLHSKAMLIEMDRGLQSPCMAKAKTNVFPMIGLSFNSDCMDLCGKLGGQSPPVRTKMEWEKWFTEIKAVSPDLTRLPHTIWLSATEGDLGDLVHCCTPSLC